MKKQNGIAILGGTFDPIHNGHLTIANWMADNLPYAKIHLIPCYCPPHSKQPIASPQQRLAMVKLAIAGNSNLIVNDCEIRRQGYSYTVDTLQQLHSELPDEPLLLALGSDVFLQLSMWHNWQKIIALAQLLIIPRPGNSLSDIAKMGKQLKLNPVPQQETDVNRTVGSYLITTTQPMLLSSTEVRQALQQQGKMTDLPNNVAEYIAQQNLYT